MDGIKLINYTVCGIKCIDKSVSLSFYKKTIAKEPDFSDYRIKGIYGANGSGKTALISSVDILKNLILNSLYLSNDFQQKELNEIINKRTKELVIEVEFWASFEDTEYPKLFRYGISLKQGKDYSYRIMRETLAYRRATVSSGNYIPVITIDNGRIEEFNTESAELKELIEETTKNLLTTQSVCPIFIRSVNDKNYLCNKDKDVYEAFLLLGLFAYGLKVFQEQTDKHINYFLSNYAVDKNLLRADARDMLLGYLNHINQNKYELSEREIIIPKKKYKDFIRKIEQLYLFIRIFKKDLLGIDVKKRIDKGDLYRCNLIMVYENYKIDAEFESTGIKKLIRLYDYICCANNGEIVFIDELDSNIHDVYLCALLEYFGEYGEGQLCFTSHNIGPMDVLKHKKKSIDFLSVDETIHSWTTNGNYSPATLYKNGMIDGSPFNVESIDFLGVFGETEDS